MTYQELASEIVRLPPHERLALLEMISRSLREDLAPQSSVGSVAKRLRGIGKPHGAPQSDAQAQDDYVDYLTEKYS